MSRLDRLKARLKEIPQRPGVYLHKNADGEVIYVGKARNLRNRVNSYIVGKGERNHPLTAALILALAEAVDGWLAALIVFAVYAAIAGGLALFGRREVEQGTPPTPERAIETTKEDIERVKQGAKEGRS